MSMENKSDYPQPHSFMGWIDENKGDFKPPVGNKIMYPNKRCQWKVMFVGGPNRRTDYHINMGEEWFYQVKGDMMLKIVDGGIFKDIIIREGECYLHPPNVPHSPQRISNTVGLVMERQRTPDEVDGLRWYCQNCHHIIYETFFHCTDLAKELKPVIEAYYSSDDMRRCKNCSKIDQAPDKSKEVMIPNNANSCVDTNIKVGNFNDNLPSRDNDVYPLPSPLNEWINKTNGIMYNDECQFNIRVERECTLSQSYREFDGEVYYYQIKGDAKLHVLKKDDKTINKLVLNEGDCYLMPPNTSHNIERSENSIGLEFTLQKSTIKIQQFCKECWNLLKETNYKNNQRPNMARLSAKINCKNCKN